MGTKLKDEEVIGPGCLDKIANLVGTMAPFVSCPHLSGFLPDCSGFVAGLRFTMTVHPVDFASSPSRYGWEPNMVRDFWSGNPPAELLFSGGGE